MSKGFLQRDKGCSSNLQEEQRKKQQANPKAELEYMNSPQPDTSWNIAEVDPVIAEHVAQKFADKENEKQTPNLEDAGKYKNSKDVNGLLGWGTDEKEIGNEPQATGNIKKSSIDPYGSGEDYNFSIFENEGGDLRLVTKVYGNKGGRVYNGHIVLKPGTTEAFKEAYYNAPIFFFENPENHQHLVNSIDFMYGGTKEFWRGEAARFIFGSIIEYYWGGAPIGATTGPLFPGGDPIIY